MNRTTPVVYLLLLFVLMYCALPTNAQQVAPSNAYEDLVSFFFEWREFRVPAMTDGVPDYSRANMERQQAELQNWQERLNAFDTAGWPVAHQVEWYMIWAEMNGLDFAHRVKQPWFRDPAFYIWFYSYKTDVPEREAPQIHGAVELPKYGWPLSAEEASEIHERLTVTSDVLAQARQNLTGDGRDLWVSGAKSVARHAGHLGIFADQVEAEYPKLAAEARMAMEATSAFADWITSQLPDKNGTSGVGKDNYTWNLQKVHLLPYTWEEEVLLMERELARSHSALRLTEHNNRDLPRLEKISDPAVYEELFNTAVTEYHAFLRDEEVLTMKPYIEPALRERVDEYSEVEGIRGFFAEVHYRDPIIMRTHDYHWIELARIREEPHPSEIRRPALRYNLFDGRAEGMATAMEELMMNAGFLDDRPRSKELIYILIAQRAARALGGLYQHGLEMTLQESAEFASKWTPWGLLPADGATIQGEEHFYLRQPAYGTSYLIGKLEIDKLIAEYARQRDGNFVLKEFMDEFNSRGVIPVSLIYWEMTGDKSMLEAAVGR